VAIYIRAFHRIGSELDLMERYVFTMRAALHEAHQEMREQVQKRAADLPEEEATEVYNGRGGSHA